MSDNRSMIPQPYRVIDRRDELADTVTLRLAPIETPIAAPEPGQFDMLWAFGVGESAISIAGRAGDELVHTIRRVGAITTALCAAEVGTVIGVRGPFGTGWGLDTARGRNVVVAAGGLGLAPLRPAIDEIIAERDAFGRVSVLIGARSPDQLLYADVVASWRSQFDLDVHLTVDTAGRSWRGDVGVITKLLDRIPEPGPQTTAFVCGPEIMMRFVAEGVTRLGVSAEQVFISIERNMKCGVGECGHCQLGPHFVCRQGPVLRWSRVAAQLAVPDR